MSNQEEATSRQRLMPTESTTLSGLLASTSCTKVPQGVVHEAAARKAKQKRRLLRYLVPFIWPQLPLQPKPSA